MRVPDEYAALKAHSQTLRQRFCQWYNRTILRQKPYLAIMAHPFAPPLEAHGCSPSDALIRLMRMHAIDPHRPVGDWLVMIKRAGQMELYTGSSEKK